MEALGIQQPAMASKAEPVAEPKIQLRRLNAFLWEDDAMVMEKWVGAKLWRDNS